MDAGQPADSGPSPDAGPQPMAVDLRGAVQKGPFVIGSSIAVSLLDADLNPTGSVFNTQTVNNLGEFSLSFEAAGPVALEGLGYYYNEVIGELSNSVLTLRALYVPEASGLQHAYVNLITHLTQGRVKSLVTAGTQFADAVAQAESEFLAEVSITYPHFAPSVHAIDMNVAGGDDDNNAYSLAVSSVFTQVALNRGGSLDAKLQEIVNTTALNFAVGALDHALKSEITTALLQLDASAIRVHLTDRLRELGSSAAAPDMNRVLDQDRDGIRNSHDNCPLVANAGQENTDGDAFGDVCDDDDDDDGFVDANDCAPTDALRTGYHDPDCDGVPDPGWCALGSMVYHSESNLYWCTMDGPMSWADAVSACQNLGDGARVAYTYEIAWRLTCSSTRCSQCFDWCVTTSELADCQANNAFFQNPDEVDPYRNNWWAQCPGGGMCKVHVARDAGPSRTDYCYPASDANAVWVKCTRGSLPDGGR
ncbi:MAG: thrombospondin type 3 repeat-containing protein [Deltaproteobacteria bacterium]|nr:thrombospondin type 3 repeat-containing protein [Deltaproteobacteria bacterium]